jgi:hypothetical protein
MSGDCCNDTGAVASGSSGPLDTPAWPGSGSVIVRQSRARTPAQHSSGRSKSALWRAAGRRRVTAGIGAKMVWARLRFRPGVVRGGLIGSSDDDRGDRSSPALLGAAAAVGRWRRRTSSSIRARRARPTVALPRVCERQTHCVAPPRPRVAAADRAIGPRPRLRRTPSASGPRPRRSTPSPLTLATRQRSFGSPISTRACAGGDRRGALVVERLDVGEARKVDPAKYRQIPNSRLRACTPAGSPEEIVRVP